MKKRGRCCELVCSVAKNPMPRRDDNPVLFFVLIFFSLSSLFKFYIYQYLLATRHGHDFSIICFV